MIHNDQGSFSESLSQLHSEFLEISDWISRSKVSHDFLSYVFSKLKEDLPCNSQTAILLEHLVTDFLAENERFLNETEALVRSSRKIITKLKSL